MGVSADYMNPRLTLFGCLKPFAGQADVAQRNAIGSWMRLSPRPQIVLFGGDGQTSSVCAELGVEYIAGAARNRWGTVTLDDLFEKAQQRSSNDIFCYVNADIVLLDDFSRAVTAAASANRRFLLIGRRWDLDVREQLAFDSDAWRQRLRDDAYANGQVHSNWGIDYFVFTRGLLDPVPPFAVGRPSFDNWFIYRARSRRAAVVDATSAVLAVHQNHDYSYHPDGRKGVRESEEALENLRLAGGQDHIFSTDDRTHVLSPAGLKVDLSPARLRRRWQRLPVLAPSVLRGPVQLLQKGVRACRRLQTLAQE